MLDSQHPEGWEKMKSMEMRGAHRKLDVEELPVGPPHFVTELVVSSKGQLLLSSLCYILRYCYMEVHVMAI